MSRPSKRIRKSDAFSAARSLPRLGIAPVRDPHWEKTWPPHPDLVDRIFPSVLLSTPDPRNPYLGYAQNDATILSASFTGHHHSLIVNHYDVWRLASILNGDNWTSNKRSFPVHYRFGDVTECHVLNEVEQGVFLKVRASLSDLGPSLQDLVSISSLGEDVKGSRFMIRANSSRHFVRKGPPFEGGFSEETVVLLRCRRLEIRDESEAGWVDFFGHQYDEMLMAFKAICPVTHWAIPDFRRWIKENLSPQGN